MPSLTTVLCGIVWFVSSASAARVDEGNALEDADHAWPWDESEWVTKLRGAFSDYSLFRMGGFKFKVNANRAAVTIRDFEIRSPVNPEQRLPMLKDRELYIELDAEMAVATTLIRALGMAEGAPTIIDVSLVRASGLEANLEEGNLETFMEKLRIYMPEDPGPPPPQPPPCPVKDPFSAKRLVGGTADARERVAHYIAKLTGLKDRPLNDAEKIKQTGKLREWVDLFNKHCDKGPNGEFDIIWQVVVGHILLDGATIQKVTGSAGIVKLGTLELKKPTAVNKGINTDMTTLGSLGSFVAATLGQTVLATMPRVPRRG